MNYEEMSDEKINEIVSVAVNYKPSDIEATACSMIMGMKNSSQKEVNMAAFEMRDKPFPDYCNNPADAWPIIVENRITIQFRDSLGLKTLAVSGDSDHADENPLRAAMICFLKMKDSEK